MSSLCINVGVYVVLVRACRGRGVCRLGACMSGEGCMSSWCIQYIHVGGGVHVILARTCGGGVYVVLVRTCGGGVYDVLVHIYVE